MTASRQFDRGLNSHLDQHFSNFFLLFLFEVLLILKKNFFDIIELARQELYIDIVSVE